MWDDYLSATGLCFATFKTFSLNDVFSPIIILPGVGHMNAVINTLTF